MRKFSKKEQKIIKRIYQDYLQSKCGYVLGNIFWFELNSLGANYKDGKIVVDQGENVCERILAIEKNIMEIYFLLSYLENNRYIYLMENPSLTNVNETTNLNPTILGDKVVTYCVSRECGEFIEKTLKQKFFLTQDLVDLIENDFKTYEDQQLEEAQKQTQAAKKQTVLSIVAVILSIISIICACFVPIYVARNESVTIDSFQYHRWDSIKVTTNSHIESIENTLNANDSVLSDISNSVNSLKNNSKNFIAK